MSTVITDRRSGAEAVLQRMSPRLRSTTSPPSSSRNEHPRARIQPKSRS
ncbi:MAG: hypothetical protein M9915_01345 [Rhizobacter sp.]|nr:hypothetical protein [Rhizobacter sp.]